MFYKTVILLIFLFINFNTLEAQADCSPEIIDIHFDGDYNSQISARIYELYQEDQAIRQPDIEMNIEQAIADDLGRREEILTYLQAGQIIHSSDLYYVALIFQHGDCSEHYQLAADLALRAYESGNSNAAWLHTAATDRYLQSIGQLQKYGTQYNTNLAGDFVLCPVNINTTDAERAEWGLPTLIELQERALSFDNLFEIESHQWARLSEIPLLGNLIDSIIIWGRCSFF